MTLYHVWGFVAGVEIDTEVLTNTGAEAYRKVLDPLCPKYGKDWKEQRRTFREQWVRLNVAQVGPNLVTA